MKKKVFICYRRDPSDKFVENLCVFLKAFYTVYRDTDNKTIPGPITKEVKKAINSSTHFLLIVDQKTFDFKEKDDWVLEEIQYVLSRKKDGQNITIIPLLTPNVEWPSKGEEKIMNNKLENLIDEKYLEMTKKEDSCLHMSEEDGQNLLKMINYETKIKKIIKSSKLPLSVICIIVAGLIAGASIYKYHASKSVKLVFAGGGSVANMIKAKTPDSLDINKYDNSLYLSLPSEHAWPMMAEEVMNKHTSNSTKNKFYPICLSALEANDSDFTKIVDSATFVNNGTVISYHIGDDSLIVYTNLFDGEDTISDQDLSNAIIKRITWNKEKKKLEIMDDFRLYITQQGSGTYFCYRQVFKDSIDIDTLKNLLTWYDEKFHENELSKTAKYLMLSSKHYTPDEVFNNREKEMKVVVGKDGRPITKSMNIYFVGHVDGGNISMPEEMVEFLKRIVDKDTVNLIKKQMHRKYSKPITTLQELIKWEQNNSINDKTY